MLNLKNAAEALPLFADKKNIGLFERNGVFTAREVVTRTDIMLENYCKVLNIEALTMIEMAKRDIWPAVNEYIETLCNTARSKKEAGAAAAADRRLIQKLSADNDAMFERAEALEGLLVEGKACGTPALLAAFFAGKSHTRHVRTAHVRGRMELDTAAKVWPFPTYGDILFSM